MFIRWCVVLPALLVAIPVLAKPLCSVNSDDTVIVTCKARKGVYPPWPGPCLYGYEREIGHAIRFNGEIYWPEGQGTALSYNETKRVVTARGAFDAKAVLAPCVEAHTTKWQNNSMAIPDSFGEKLGTPMFGASEVRGVGGDEGAESESVVADAEALGRLFIAAPKSLGARRLAGGAVPKRIEFEASNSVPLEVAELPAAPAAKEAVAATELALPSHVEFSGSSVENAKLAPLPQLPAVTPNRALGQGFSK